MEKQNKTRGRTPLKAAEPVEALTPTEAKGVDQALTVIAQEASIITALEQKQGISFEVGQQVGRIQALKLISDVSEKAIVETFIQIRDSKKYKEILIPCPDGQFRPSEDFFDFCEQVFGKSYKALAELAQNYNLLGGELYEHAERLGLRTKDYRALRALPADEQKLVQLTLAEAGDRESVADLIHELADRHAQERAALRKDLEDAQADLKAKDSVLADKSKQLDAARAKIERRASMPEAEREKDFEQSLNDTTLEVIGAMQKLRGPLAAVSEEFADVPEGLLAACGGALSRVLAELEIIARTYGLALALPFDDDLGGA